MDTDKCKNVWTPVGFSERWLEAATAKFDDLAPSWYKRRENLAGDDCDYKEFLERLKREHAIETGIIEKLYDLSDGVTQTFIKEGFVEAYIGHGDTNISPQQLMGYLDDHFQALDSVFAVVQDHRDLSKSFIKQLHAQLTTHQRTTPAVNGLGRAVDMELRRGEFKRYPNNPRREDGTLCLYCPPEQVDSEMERLLAIYEQKSAENVNPIIVSAWFHHAFTQIHPFQDGNGRIARLLSSLIWIKKGLFPLTVRRSQKSAYIGALEKADAREPSGLVAFFSEAQSRSIDSFLNYREVRPKDTLAEVAALFGDKVSRLRQKEKEKRQHLLKGNRNKVFDEVYRVVGELKNELKELRTKGVDVRVTSVLPEDEKAHWYTKQIADYASSHGYYFNKLLPRGWFQFMFLLPARKRYDLIVTVHHSTYGDSVMAIGLFLEFFDESAPEQSDHTDRAAAIPVGREPHKISVEEINERLLRNVESYIRDAAKIGLALIANEIV
jgi:Fic family protein